MKKNFTLRSIFFSLMWMAFTTGKALTFTVTVPSGTVECYIAGNFNSWKQTKMNKIGNNQFQIDFETTSAEARYKYCSGPGWQYVEKSASGQDIIDRTYNSNDNVASWAAIYSPNITPGNITITATVPANTPDGEVYISGSFQSPAWDVNNAPKLTKVSDTQYQFIVQNVTTIEYKLLCGKSWDNVEATADHNDIVNRNASVESPNVNITVESWMNVASPTNLITHTFTSFLPLEGTRRIIIYLPPDYHTNTTKHYPVLYMHDGQNIFEQGPFGSWNMQAALQELYNAGKNVGIVVGIDNGAGRLKEYAPFPNPNYENGIAQGNAYLQAIKDIVIPYVNASYRTLTGRENTGICGSSMGGLISYYAALKEESVFGRIGVISPSFWFCKNDLSAYLANWTGNHKANTRIYFICGDNEGESTVADMQSFYTGTKAKQFDEANLKQEVVIGGAHNEAAWSQQIGRVYEFLFQPTPPTSISANEALNDIRFTNKNKALTITNNSKHTITVTLFDTLGKYISDTTIDSDYSSSSLKAGIYIARIQSKERTFTRKIVIN